MRLKDFIETCGQEMKAKGFKLDQHTTQLVLIASEVAEALECVAPKSTTETNTISMLLQVAFERYEAYRKEAVDYHDTSEIKDKEALLEEVVDILIRVASWVGGNNLTDEFMAALERKVEKNKQRPHLHGKGF